MLDRIHIRTVMMVYRNLHNMAPEYLSELFVQPTSRPSRYFLLSASSNQLNHSSVILTTYGARAFSSSDPAVYVDSI